MSSAAEFRAEVPRPPKGFPLFSALKMASPDTIILLVVDYHAAIGGKTPPCPPLHTPLNIRVLFLYVARCSTVKSFRTIAKASDLGVAQAVDGGADACTHTASELVQILNVRSS